MKNGPAHLPICLHLLDESEFMSRTLPAALMANAFIIEDNPLLVNDSAQVSAYTKLEAIHAPFPIAIDHLSHNG